MVLFGVAAWPARRHGHRRPATRSQPAGPGRGHCSGDVDRAGLRHDSAADPRAGRCWAGWWRAGSADPGSALGADAAPCAGPAPRLRAVGQPPRAVGGRPGTLGVYLPVHAGGSHADVPAAFASRPSPWRARWPAADPGGSRHPATRCATSSRGTGGWRISEWQSPNFHDAANWGSWRSCWRCQRGRGTPGWLQALALVGVALGPDRGAQRPDRAVLALPTLALDSRTGSGSRQRAQRPSRCARRSSWGAGSWSSTPRW